MTFGTLRALHTIIGTALDDIELVYRGGQPSLPPQPQPQSQAPCPLHSPPPSPTTASRFSTDSFVPKPPPVSAPHPTLAQQFSSFSWPGLNYPSLDEAFYPSNPLPSQADAEELTSHPAVIAAASKIVAACGQISASVQRPFLTICDAAMGVSTLLNRLIFVFSCIAARDLLHSTWHDGGAWLSFLLQHALRTGRFSWNLPKNRTRDWVSVICRSILSLHGKIRYACGRQPTAIIGW